jgi:hypothetical protein
VGKRCKPHTALPSYEGSFTPLYDTWEGRAPPPWLLSYVQLFNHLVVTHMIFVMGGCETRQIAGTP